MSHHEYNVISLPVVLVLLFIPALTGFGDNRNIDLSRNRDINSARAHGMAERTNLDRYNDHQMTEFKLLANRNQNANLNLRRKRFDRGIGDKTIWRTGAVYYNRPSMPVIHVLGMYNSGTNVLAMTLKSCSTGISITMNGPFWKHLLPSLPMFTVDPTNVYTALIRNPLAWVASMRLHSYDLHCGPNISDSCTLSDPLWPVVKFDNIVGVWLRYLTEYISFQQKFPNNVYLFKYEDLLVSGFSVITDTLIYRPELQFFPECKLFTKSARPWYNSQFLKICFIYIYIYTLLIYIYY